VFWSQGKWVPILFGFMCLTLLLSARSFNFSRDWFAVGRVLENSAELRKETHYALALARWLELEAERTASVEELWSDFIFTVRKMRFASVRLAFSDGERTWRSSETLAGGKALSRTHELSLEGGMFLEFGGDADVMSERVFVHLSELAAESWLKAASRWRACNEKPVRFGPSASLGSASATLPTAQTKVAPP